MRPAYVRMYIVLVYVARERTCIRSSVLARLLFQILFEYVLLLNWYSKQKKKNGIPYTVQSYTLKRDTQSSSYSETNDWTYVRHRFTILSAKNKIRNRRRRKEEEESEIIFFIERAGVFSPFICASMCTWYGLLLLRLPRCAHAQYAPTNWVIRWRWWHYYYFFCHKNRVPNKNKKTNWIKMNCKGGTPLGASGGSAIAAKHELYSVQNIRCPKNKKRLPKCTKS